MQFAEIRQCNRSLVHHVIVDVRSPGNGPLPPTGELNPENLRAGVRARKKGQPIGRQTGGIGPGRGAAFFSKRAMGKTHQGWLGSDIPVHYTPNGEPRMVARV